MIKDIEQLEVSRKIAYNRQQKYVRIALPFVFLAIASVVLTVILTIMDDTNPAALLPLLFGALCIIVSIIINNIGYANKKNFKLDFKEKIIRALLNDRYQNVLYKPENSLNESDIVESKLARKPDRFNGEDYFAGNYKGITFRTSDVILKQRRTSHSKYGSTTTYVPYFTGRWYIFEFKKQFKEQLRVIEKDFSNWGFAPSGFKKVETESIGFNQEFRIESTDEAFAFYIITSQMIEQLKIIESNFKGSISFLWKKNTLHVAVNDGKNAFEPKFNKPLNDENLKDIIRDLEIPKMIIEKLNLEHLKYANEK